jgi:hypothetical protein
MASNLRVVLFTASTILCMCCRSEETVKESVVKGIKEKYVLAERGLPLQISIGANVTVEQVQRLTSEIVTKLGYKDGVTTEDTITFTREGNPSTNYPLGILIYVHKESVSILTHGHKWSGHSNQFSLDLAEVLAVQLHENSKKRKPDEPGKKKAEEPGK